MPPSLRHLLEPQVKHPAGAVNELARMLLTELTEDASDVSLGSSGDFLCSCLGSLQYSRVLIVLCVRIWASMVWYSIVQSSL